MYERILNLVRGINRKIKYNNTMIKIEVLEN